MLDHRGSEVAVKNLRNIIAGIKNKFFAPKKGLSENSVSLLKFDKLAVQNEVAKNKDLSKIIENGEKTNTGFMRLFEDLFGSLYKQAPSLLDEQSISEEFRGNREHIKKLMESSDYEKLRESTALNRSLSVVSAQKLAKSILEANPEDSRNRKALKEEAEYLQELINQAEESASPQNEAYLVSKIEESEKKIELLRSSLINNQTVSTQTVRNGLKELAESVEQFTTSLRGFGFSDEQIERISPDRTLKLLDSLVNNFKVKELVKLIGRFRKIANRLLKKSVQKENFTISGITMGDEISEATENELANFSHARLRYDSLRRWQDGELELYEREDTITSGKGPVVAVIDTSGSMEGEKEAYAKALTMSYLEVARKQKRDMYIIYFNDYVQKEYFLKKGRTTPENIIEILSFCSGGNTNFEKPLNRAKKIITTNSCFLNADILFVTDGIAYVSEGFIKSFMKARKKYGFKVVSVFIPDKRYMSKTEIQNAQELLSSLSDSQITLEKLTEKNAEEIIKKLFQK